MVRFNVNGLENALNRFNFQIAEAFPIKASDQPLAKSLMIGLSKCQLPVRHPFRYW